MIENNLGNFIIIIVLLAFVFFVIGFEFGRIFADS